MNVIFYLAAAVALLATLAVITRLNVVHALLYLVVSLLAVALMFILLGAPFAAALEVIIYAGAIMVLFVFAIMMLNLGPQARRQERQWLHPRMFVGPGILALLLLAELVYVLAARGDGTAFLPATVDPAQVGIALYGPYLVGVELSSMLLLAALVGAYHLSHREPAEEEELTPEEHAELAGEVLQVPTTAGAPAATPAPGQRRERVPERAPVSAESGPDERR